MEAACDYADRGWPVVPVRPRDKSPWFQDWQKLVSTHRSDIEMWWRDNPQSNVGVAMGPDSGLIDVECDSDEAEKQLGLLLGEDAPVVPTYRGKRGKHRLFQYSEDLPKPENAWFKFRGIEFRTGNGGKGAQSVFPPSIHPDGPVYQWLVTPDEADPVPFPKAALALIREELAKSTNGNGHATPTTGDKIPTGQRNDAAYNRAWAYIDKIARSISGKGGHNQLWSAARALVGKFELSDAEISSLLHRWNIGCKPEWSDKEIAHKIEEARTKATHLPQPDAAHIGGNDHSHRSDEPARIQFDAGNQDLAIITPAAIQSLVASNDPPRLFRHAGPARIERDENDAPIIRSLARERMQHELARVARWTKEKKVGKEFVTVDSYPPRTVVEDVLATPELPFPALVRVIEAPAFAADGTLHDQPGYHPATRAFYEPAPGFDLPSVPAEPTIQQIRDAITLIVEPFWDFPFVSDADRAHAIAAMILPFARDLIEGPTPLHLCEAPSPGSGKTLMVGAITYPALGRPVVAMTEGKDEDEWRKRVLAKLRSGPSAINLDNLRRRLDSAALSSVLTAWPHWEDRLLGFSETACVPVRCLWMATGNNPALSNEMARRTVRIRIDPKQDRPWLRDGCFRHPNLLDWLKAQRGQIVAAILTVIQAWIKAGRPENKRTLGMFEAWTKTIGGILDVAGVPGFLANLEEFYEVADSEGAKLRAFIATWWDQLHGAEIATAALWDIANEVELNIGDGNERSQKIRLGKLLAEHRDRTFSLEMSNERNNLRVEYRGTSK
jgi:hypothetical protein